MALNQPITDWHGKVVWIIGAGSGIGLSLALQLQQKGARIWASGRDAGKLTRFNHVLALDATDALAIRTGFAQLMQSEGKLDMLIYCAGHYEPLSVFEHTPEKVQQHLATNYLGAAYAVHAVLHSFKAQGFGHICLVASVAGYRGLPRALAYGSSKAALQHMGEVLYLELKGLGLGVSVVNPGFVKTPLTAKNDFPMPFIMDADQAAQRLVRGLEKGQFEIAFPRRFAFLLKLLQMMPHRLYFYLAGFTVKKGSTL
jgi:NAD(P)-dependent dehydrogenase (short-subunit alcohol dehydrogenase family)